MWLKNVKKSGLVFSKSRREKSRRYRDQNSNRYHRDFETDRKPYVEGSTKNTERNTDKQREETEF